MRTTIRLDDELLQQVKLHAAEQGTTLTALIEGALREKLSRGTPDQKRNRITLLTVDGPGLMPGVDLDDSATLLDLMEESLATYRRKRSGLRSSE